MLPVHVLPSHGGWNRSVSEMWMEMRVSTGVVKHGRLIRVDRNGMCPAWETLLICTSGCIPSLESRRQWR